MAMYLLVCGALPITSAHSFLLERLLANFAPTGSAFVRDLHLALVTLMLKHIARVERVQGAIGIDLIDLRQTHTISVRV